MSRIGMQHLTLDTGHTRVSFIGEIADEALAAVSPLVAPGRHLLPVDMGGWPTPSVQVTSQPGAALATVFRGRAPLVMIAVAADEPGGDMLWDVLVAGAATIARRDPTLAPMPPRPSAVPWMAVRLLPGMLRYPEDAHWLGDFERCWAWAWLATQNLQGN